MQWLESGFSEGFLVQNFAKISSKDFSVPFGNPFLLAICDYTV